MASLQAGLFAIVYRYCIRTDNNPMLNQGVVGAFVLTRTLSNIQTTTDCVSVPLRCKYFLPPTKVFSSMAVFYGVWVLGISPL